MELLIYIGAVFAAMVILAWTLDYDDKMEEDEHEDV
jgi:NADH:ubiquinone oxidoreductase subunit 6 (subunit J)